jgi:HEAT repeat protein
MRAAQALGQIGDPRAVEPLVAALGDRNKTVRGAVAEALDQLGWKPGQDEAGAWYWIAQGGDWAPKCLDNGAPAVEPLIACLEAGQGRYLGLRGWSQSLQKQFAKDVATRQAAAEALGQIGDHRAIEPLRAALDVPDEWLRAKDNTVFLAAARARTAALSALTQIDPSRAVEFLSAALEDRQLSLTAVHALAELDDPRAVEPLAVALEMTSVTMRRAASRGLGQIGARLDDAALCAPAIQPLIAALDDSDPTVQRAAAEALGQIGDPRAIAPLIARLDAYESLRRDVAEALLEIGDPATEHLIDRLQEPEASLSWNQARALALFYHKGRLNDRQKQLVLGRRDAIERHLCSTEVVDQGQGCGHYDYERHTDQHVDLASDVEL